MWRNSSGYTRVAAINFTHEGIPDLVTRRVGVLIFIFQPIADCEFTFLVEYARDVKLHHTIVAEVTRQLVIILFDENEERSQVTLSREVYQRVACYDRITHQKHTFIETKTMLRLQRVST